VDGVTGGAPVWLRSDHLDKNVCSVEADFVLFLLGALLGALAQLAFRH
jgi:hypothetical protein